mmetsp:Transcript_36108/g.83995  ORF Transcript_36108/g.83995 Transcript_36108/m.83995 type:complete len:201 (-) Transcript_36108:542-1144(-)
MLGEGSVHALTQELGLQLLVHLAGDVIEAGRGRMEVARDGVEAALAQALDAGPGQARVRRAGTRGRPALGRRAVVHGLAQGSPAHIRAGEAAFEDGRGGRERQQHGRQNGELVVEAPRLVHALRLEGHLQAAHAHAIGHAVHLDAGRRRRRGGGGREFGGRRVLEERHADVHLAAAPAADVRRERAEARVPVDAGVGHGV